jgi:hypothetical protein
MHVTLGNNKNKIKVHDDYTYQIPCSSVDVQSFDNHKFCHVKEHFHKGPATGSFGGGSVGCCLMSAKTIESSWSKASRSTAKLSS